MDLKLVEKRLAAGDYYLTLDIFVADLKRLFDNCRFVCVGMRHRSARMHTDRQ